MVWHINFALELPDDLRRFRLPKALQRRLNTLLARQDSGERLTAEERAEAMGLVQMAELLTLLKLRSESRTKAGR